MSTVPRWFVTYILNHFLSVKTGSAILFKLNFGVPQVTVFGAPLLFLYTTPLSQVIANYIVVKYQFYAVDNTLLNHLSPGNCANSFHQIKACLNDIHTWMFENKLKLNAEKQFIVFDSIERYKWLTDSFPSIFWEFACLQLMFVNWVYCWTENLVSLIISVP